MRRCNEKSTAPYRDAGRRISTARLTCCFWAVLPCFAQTDSVAQLIESGHWKRARAVVEKRIREAPDDPSANFFLSQIRNAFGDYATPLDLAQRAVVLAPHVARYHRQVAEVLGVTAQHANAIQQLFLAGRFRKEIEIALKLDPSDTQALRDMVEFYLLAPGIVGGDRQKALMTAEQIVAIDPAEGFLALARISEFEHRRAEVEAWLGKAVQAQPTSQRARIALARFLLSSGNSNLAAAEQAANDVLRLAPGRIEGYAMLATVYAQQERFVALDSLLHDSLREVPDDHAAYYRAAERLSATGRDLARAEGFLRIYLAQEPEGNEPSLVEARHLLNRVVQERHAPGQVSGGGKG